jgi:hypothetical protein
MIAVSLIPFAATPFIDGLRVRVWREARLRVRFEMEGDLERLRMPPTPPSQAPQAIQGERLWEHTCFEVFMGCEADERYREFNVAPSRQWATYAFRRRREAEARDLSGIPVIQVERTERNIALDLALPLEPMFANAPLRLGLSAVLEDTTGACSHWALRHPGDRPDFHHPDSFALRLPSESPQEHP